MDINKFEIEPLLETDSEMPCIYCKTPTSLKNLAGTPICSRECQNGIDKYLERIFYEQRKCSED